MPPINTKVIACKAGPVHETVAGQGLVELTRVHLDLRVENKDAQLFSALEVGEVYRITIEQMPTASGQAPAAERRATNEPAETNAPAANAAEIKA